MQLIMLLPIVFVSIGLSLLYYAVLESGRQKSLTRGMHIEKNFNSCSQSGAVWSAVGLGIFVAIFLFAIAYILYTPDTL